MLSVSLSAWRCGTRMWTEYARRLRRFDVHVHLLTHMQSRVLVFHAIDDLENACVHALGASGGQRFLGDHVRLKAHELQRDSQRTVAPRGGHGRGATPYAPGILLIHTRTNMKRSDTSKDHQKLTEQAALRVLTQPHFVLQH